jgi:hypothetical protein
MDNFKYIVGVALLCAAPILITQCKNRPYSKRTQQEVEDSSELSGTIGCPFLANPSSSATIAAPSTTTAPKSDDKHGKVTKSLRPNPREVLAKYRADNPRVIGLCKCTQQMLFR